MDSKEKQYKKALCKRALQSKHWKWYVGCVNELGEVYTGPYIFYRGSYPDIFQPASLGCFIEVVKKAYNGKLFITHHHTYWHVETQAPLDLYVWDQNNTGCFQEALVNALEAAP